jgi:GNAT superfamily N-acetyltransferase
MSGFDAPAMSGKLTVRPVTLENWPDLETLFETKGAPSYCWCMAWRAMADRTRASSADRKAALHQRVKDGVPVGLIGYLDGEAVAWCSVAPRETFRQLKPDQIPEAGAWSVVCFYIRREYRSRGLSSQLLEEAVKAAKASGAKFIEAYPVDPDSPSYRFMGFVSLFERCGFEPTGKAGSRRHVMRRDL